MTQSKPFTPEQEARIRAIFVEERLSFRKALPALAADYQVPSARTAPRGGGRMLRAGAIASFAMLLMLGWMRACTR